jgi:hypothetical protein
MNVLLPVETKRIGWRSCLEINPGRLAGNFNTKSITTSRRSPDMADNIRPFWQACSSRLQYWWRLAIPFWMFRDAGRGTIEQRIANYRYNREHRKVLPFYLWKWIAIALCLMQVMRVLSDQMVRTTAQSVNHLCATLACMSAGIGFAFACIVIVLLCATYLYLTYVKR